MRPFSVTQTYEHATRKLFGVPLRYLYLTYAFLQNLSGAGLIFGWAAISESLLPDSNLGPGLPDSTIHLTFSVACSVSFIAPWFLGLLLDWTGPRVCNIFSQTLITGGLALFGMSKTTSGNYFLLAIAAVAAGGPGVQSSVLHLNHLFPHRAATVTAAVTGAFALSFTVFILFNLLWQAGFNYQQIFCGYSIYSTLLIVASFFIWPGKPFSGEEIDLIETDGEESDDGGDPMRKIQMPEVFLDVAELGRSRAPATPTVEDYLGRLGARERQQALDRARRALVRRALRARARRNLKGRSFWRQLRSAPYIRLTILFVVTTFWMNVYIGTLGSQLADLGYPAGGAAARAAAAQRLTALMTAGTLCTPLAGVCMDKLGFPWTAAFILANSVIWASAQLFQTTTALYVGFVAYSIFRTMLFTYYFAKLADVLGFRFFGVLSGTTFLVAGLVGFLQYPIATFGRGSCSYTQEGVTGDLDGSGCKNNHWTLVNTLQLISLALIFICPLFDHLEVAEAAAAEADYGRQLRGYDTFADGPNNKNHNTMKGIELIGQKQQEEEEEEGSLNAAGLPTMAVLPGRRSPRLSF